MERRVFGVSRRRDWSKLSPEGAVLGRPRPQAAALVTPCSLRGELISSPLLGAECLVGTKSSPTGGTGIRLHPPLRLLLLIDCKQEAHGEGGGGVSDMEKKNTPLVVSLVLVYIVQCI